MIREAIKEKGMVAIGRVVFTSWEHVIALEPRGKGRMGITTRYAYEVREEEYYGNLKDEKITKEMMLVSRHRPSIFGGTAWWDSSCPAASLQAGVDARGTRGDFQPTGPAVFDRFRFYGFSLIGHPDGREAIYQGVSLCDGFGLSTMSSSKATRA